MSEGENCDDGNTVTEMGTCPYGQTTCPACNATCTAPINRPSGGVCGDTVTQAPNEQCDDGNTDTETRCPYGTASCTGCDSSCRDVPGLTGNVCGDGVRDTSNETCDDGNTSTCGTCGGPTPTTRCSVTQALQAATGSIVCVNRASTTDGTTFTLNDGVHPAVVFEFDSDAMFNPANTQVNLTGQNTATEVADAVRTAINGLPSTTLAITAGGATATVTLTNDAQGAFGNQTITTTLMTMGYSVSGMSGGRGRDCPATTGCASTNDCAPGLTCQPAGGGGLTCQ